MLAEADSNRGMVGTVGDFVELERTPQEGLRLATRPVSASDMPRLLRVLATSRWLGRSGLVDGERAT